MHPQHDNDAPALACVGNCGDAGPVRRAPRPTERRPLSCHPLGTLIPLKLGQSSLPHDGLLPFFAGWEKSAEHRRSSRQQARSRSSGP